MKTGINITVRTRIRTLVSKENVMCLPFTKFLFENYNNMQINLRHLMNTKKISTLSTEGVTTIYSLPGVSL